MLTAEREIENIDYNDELLLIFGDMRQPVRLVDCSDLLEHFSLVFPGWSILETLNHSQVPIVTIQRRDREYVLTGDWIEAPIRRPDRVSAICALVAELIRAWVCQDDRLLCLHGAAAVFAGKLVVFPNSYRAGKSLLSACLAAAGNQIFCDDVLPLSLAAGYGIAPGLAPRLRLPIPDNLSAAMRDYIEGHRDLCSDRYAYLDLGSPALAPRGWRLPIGAFVLLERRAGAEPQLEAASEADILRQVVWQNFAREAEAPGILDVLTRVVRQAGCFRLRYDRVEEAVALLQQAFDRWPEQSPRPAGIAAPSPGEPGATIQPGPGCYLRNPQIAMVESDDQRFLADSDGAAIYHLNSIGSAIWNLLEKPMSVAQISQLLLTAFPDLEAAQVETDVGRLCRVLARHNLLSYGGD